MAFLHSIKKHQLGDAEMVRLYQSGGDLAVLAELYEGYMDLVYGVSLKYLEDREKARDAVMQIFEELVIKLKSHEVVHFKSWLYILAKNHCLMQLRSPRNLKTTELNTVDMHSESEMHLNGEPDLEENLAKMKVCLEKLPPPQKITVSLFYLEQKTYQEIAEITGHEWNQVRSFIQNGRRNLKICMQKDNEISVSIHKSKKI